MNLKIALLEARCRDLLAYDLAGFKCESELADADEGRVVLNRKANLRGASAALLSSLGLAAAAFVPGVASAAVNLVWSCTSATAGSTVNSCAGTWSWQVGANGVLVASAVTYGGYGTGTWRLWENVPSNQYVFVCTTDLAVGAPEGCPSPGVYTHEWYVLKSTLQDTQAPTVPSSVSASAASSTQINVSWTASTDNVGVTGYRVERCQGASCTNFAQVGTPSASPFNNTGLTASTTYRYRVRATDAATNLSSYSSIVSATTTAGGDVTPPSVPTGVSATPVSSTQINLSWTASTDNVAVTGYLVERCQGTGCSSFTQIATPTTTSYSDTGRTASTAYRYRVRARDAVPNYSGYSSVQTATTPSAADSTPPSTPSGLTVTPQLGGQNSLAWSASTDNVAVTGYLVERCAGAGCVNFAQIATPSTITYIDTGLTPTTNYRYRVRARDAVPNYSGYSSIDGATPADCD